jgi:protein SCO1
VTASSHPSPARGEGAWPRLGRVFPSIALALLAASALALVAASAFAHDAGIVRELDFEPPAPGSYVLQHIMDAPDGTVLDTGGKRKPLAEFTRGKVTVLSFIYTTCADPQGCPAAYEAFGEIKKQILSRPELEGKVRLVSLSFDPLRDTPRTMKHYGGSHVKDDHGLKWFFLTTPSPKNLLPLLDGFGQDVRYAAEAKSGNARRELSHVLKVFLIDKHGHVREIYTTAFLFPQVVLNDIETLLMEEGVLPRAVSLK